MLLNFHSIACIRFWYWRLDNFEKTSNTHEDLMTMDALTTGIVISYGRLFSAGNGSTKLNSKIIPPPLNPVHQEILNLRNTKYAHHGGHESVESRLEIHFKDESIDIIPNLEIIVCLGAPKEWASLLEWLDTYMYKTIGEQLSLLKKKTGIEWNMPHSDPPRWV